MSGELIRDRKGTNSKRVKKSVWNLSQFPVLHLEYFKKMGKERISKLRKISIPEMEKGAEKHKRV